MPRLLVFIVCFFALQLEAVDNAERGPIGRYQLFQATVKTYATGPGTANPQLCRIDTVTGRTWMLASLVKDSNFVSFWIPVKEPTQAAEPSPGELDLQPSK
jgi:hypothetical protein